MTRQQQHAKRRKRKCPPAASRAAELPPSCAPQLLKEGEEQHIEESNVLYTLMEAFDSISLHEAFSVRKEANGDVNKAAEILANLSDCGVDNDPSMSSVSSGGLSFSDSGNGSSSSSSGSSLSSGCSGSSEGFMGLHKGGNKQKRVAAVAGTVSAVLGKGYVKAASPRRDLVRETVMKGFGHGGMVLKEEEAEQFLCSMLGGDCELNMGVVRDVLCQCGFNIEKAFEILLGLLGLPMNNQTTVDRLTTLQTTRRKTNVR